MDRLGALLLVVAAITAALLLLSALPGARGFYLPGSYQHKYNPGDPLSVKVNSLTSIDTEMPFSYYSLPFCVPSEGVKDSAENLGELLMGDRIENSPYRFKMYTNESDVFLCRSAPLAPDAFALLKKHIDEMYQVRVRTRRLAAAPCGRRLVLARHRDHRRRGLRVQSVRGRDDRGHWRWRQVCLLSSRRRLPRMVGPREKMLGRCLSHRQMGPIENRGLD
jgi:hypothetical protein